MGSDSMIRSTNSGYFSFEDCSDQKSYIYLFFIYFLRIQEQFMYLNSERSELFFELALRVSNPIYIHEVIRTHKWENVVNEQINLRQTF